MGQVLIKIFSAVAGGLLLAWVLYAFGPGSGDRDPDPGGSTVAPPQAASQYDRLLGAVVAPASRNNPLQDTRVQTILREFLSPTGGNHDLARRLLYEAGYPDGLTILVATELYPGGRASLDETRGRLGLIGVRLDYR